MSAKIRKSQATINLGTSVQIYNLKVRALVLYIVTLSELKLNENSEHDEVVKTCTKICCMFESFLISGGIRKYSLRNCHRFSA